MTENLTLRFYNFAHRVYSIIIVCKFLKLCSNLQYSWWRVVFVMTCC